MLPAMRAWRKSFHEEPELSNEEARTRVKVADALSGLGLRPTTYAGFNGVSATLAILSEPPTAVI